MKTIEEKAKVYAESVQKGYFPNQCIPNDVIANEARIAYIQGAKDLLLLPLAERLTEEENKKIRKLFEEANEYMKLNKCAISQQAQIVTLYRVFGTDFFKEGGEK